jgi:plastocyanin
MHRLHRHHERPLRVAVVLLGTALLQAAPLATPLAAQSAHADMTHAPVASRAIGSATVMAAHVVNITTTDYAFDMPATLPSGLTTMRLANKGKELHHVYLVKVPAGKSSKDILAWFKAGGPPPAWMKPVGGRNASAGITEFTSTREAGDYVAFCVIPSPDGTPHVMKGMITDLKVTPSANRSAAPTPTRTLTLKDYDFIFDKPLTSGTHVIAVKNSGPQPHEFFLAKLMPGKTPMEMAQFAEKPVGAPPGIPFGGITDILPGQTVYLTVDLPAGEYGIICFDPDVKDGKPHLAHGMIKQLSVR